MTKISDKYTIIVFSFIFLICCLVFHNSVYCADDLLYHFFERPIALIHDFYYGTWIMPFQNISMYYIPYKLGINFQIWAMTFGTLIKALTVTLMIYSFYKTFRAFQIKSFLSSLLSFLVFMMFFVLYSVNNFVDFVLFSGFFRFIIPSCLLIISLYIFNKLLWGEKFNTILLFIVLFLSAYSSEMLGGILLPFTFMLLIYQCLSKDKNNIKPIFVALIALSLGTFCLLSSAGFHYHVSDKLSGYVFSVSSLLYSFPEFIRTFSKSLICDYAIVWLFSLFLIFSNIRHNSNKYNVVPVSILLSVITFSLFLIFLGKTSYDGGFWIEHKDIYSVFIPAFLYSISLLAVPFFKEPNKKISFRCIFALIFIICSVFFFKSCYALSSELRLIKNNVYLWDKIRLFYNLKSMPPVFPVPEQYSYLFVRSDAVFNMDKYYYPLNYKADIGQLDKNAVFMDYNEGLEVFVNNGGCYNEILNGKYDFRNLENKDFILRECSEK